ncbi:putative internal head protein [Escherichia phage vb_EcoM-VR5]|uniref:Putative internal head protein n=1 Tax=Escherichia phage vb_EcoM-VR5 TaxID=1567026 RepID=A0A0A7HF72_9CAUD|nr:internal head protein [Escherichia phage vb_EcoM-VR5]AIZ01904.1 putative internal head protein [Escherichia phage vb_EcoM-VR5]
MKTYQEFITEAKAPKAFQIGVQGTLDQQYVDAIVNSLTNNGVTVDLVDFSKGNTFNIVISKGSLAKIKKSFGVAQAYEIDHSEVENKGRQNTIKGSGSF